MGTERWRYPDGVATELLAGAPDGGGYVLSPSGDAWESFYGDLLPAPAGSNLLVDAAERLAHALEFSDPVSGVDIGVECWMVELDGTQVTFQVHLGDGAGSRFIRELIVARDGTVAGRFTSGHVRARGTGRGRRFADHCLGVFAAAGAEKVRVLAAEVGAYVWAKAGFEPRDRSRLASQLSSAIGRGLPVTDTSASFDDWRLSDPEGLAAAVERFSVGQLSLAELASWGRDRVDAAGVHDGKKLLCAGVAWEGYWFPRSAAAVAAAA